MWIEGISIKSNQEEAIEGITREYPYVMHFAEITGLRIPWHWHEELEFGYVTGGEIEVMTADKSYVFRKNEAFFINTNVLCSMQGSGKTESGVVQSHLFHPVFLGGHFKSVFETKYMNPVLRNKNLEILEIRGANELQKKILKKLSQAEYIQKQQNAEFLTRNIFSEIWLLLLEEIERVSRELPSVNLKNTDRIQSMLSYIHQNYMYKISLEQIAGAASVSTRECLRCFRETIDKTPVEYLMDYRLDMAKKLLKETKMSITEISYHSGFSGSAYFGKIFRQRCGMTPMECRRGKIRRENF